MSGEKSDKPPQSEWVVLVAFTVVNAALLLTKVFEVGAQNHRQLTFLVGLTGYKLTLLVSDSYVSLLKT